MELLVGRQLIVIVVLILAVLIALWILASTRRSQR
jgi:hypothetical protein